MVDETEIRVKLLGIDQKASAVGIPFFCLHVWRPKCIC
jgi:hypothetical protein